MEKSIGWSLNYFEDYNIFDLKKMHFNSRINHRILLRQVIDYDINSANRGAWWLSGRASDFGARGREVEIFLRRVVSLSKTLYSPKVLVIPRKRLLRPNRTEKMLT